LHVLVGLVHAMVSGSSSGPNITRPLRKRMPARPQAAVNAGTLEDAVISANWFMNFVRLWIEGGARTTTGNLVKPTATDA
jgi:hypothetical protein